MPTVLITGANRGLGLAFAQSYAADGWRVIATAREPERTTTLGTLPGDVSVHALEVSDEAQLDKLARALRAEPIDVLINNAGVRGETDTPGWLRTFAVNSIAPLRVAQALMPCLQRGERKVIASITSGLGSIGDNTSGGSYAYRSSKAALNMAMKSLSVELAPRGFSVFVISPGWVQTDMGGGGAPLTPAESIAGMRRVIDAAGPAQNGKFLHYDGREYPW
jgi:NAD(P)-dependent dehydrogenase (short-subunit alcohol dehydrogenase family)